MASHHPYYRKWLPSKKNEQDYRGMAKLIDLTKAWIADEASDPVTEARALLDDRAAAAAIRATAAVDGTDMVQPRFGQSLIGAATWVTCSGSRAEPEPWFKSRDLLEMKWYDGKAPTIHIPQSSVSRSWHISDFFPGNPRLGLGLRSMVSRAVLSSTPGWCGLFRVQRKRLSKRDQVGLAQPMYICLRPRGAPWGTNGFGLYLSTHGGKHQQPQATGTVSTQTHRAKYCAHFRRFHECRLAGIRSDR